MSSAAKTANLQLNQWQLTDFVNVEDFNADNAAIDAAMPRVKTGSYVGNGSSGSSTPNSITFDFVPKLIIVTHSTSAAYRLIWHTGCSLAVSLLHDPWNSTVNCSLTGKTFSWYSGSDAAKQLNSNGATFYYFAIG